MGATKQQASSGTPSLDVLNETKTIINDLALGGAGAAEVYIARFPKPQQKKIAVNVYLGDTQQGRRPSGSGYTFVEIPVHVHLQLLRTEALGASIMEDAGAYLDQIFNALRLRRPSSLSIDIPNFWLTEVDWDDTDTETGTGSSSSSGVTKTLEGFLTVRWQFWRPN